MKQVIVLLALCATVLTSCTDRHKTVKLANGALVEAFNPTDIDYSRGNQVCMTHSLSSYGETKWTICSDGEFQDTSYVVNYKRDGIDRTSIIIHKTGYILR